MKRHYSDTIDNLNEENSNAFEGFAVEFESGPPTEYPTQKCIFHLEMQDLMEIEIKNSNSHSNAPPLIMLLEETLIDELPVGYKCSGKQVETSL